MPRMTSKGQVTIPKRIRDYLGLKPGSQVEFEPTENGKVVLEAGSGARRVGRDAAIEQPRQQMAERSEPAQDRRH